MFTRRCYCSHLSAHLCLRTSFLSIPAPPSHIQSILFPVIVMCVCFYLNLSTYLDLSISLYPPTPPNPQSAPSLSVPASLALPLALALLLFDASLLNSLNLSFVHCTGVSYFRRRRWHCPQLGSTPGSSRRSLRQRPWPWRQQRRFKSRRKSGVKSTRQQGRRGWSVWTSSQAVHSRDGLNRDSKPSCQPLCQQDKGWIC